MKKLLLIPTLLMLCLSCNRGTYSNNEQNVYHESSSDWSITSKVKASIMSDSSISGSSRYVSVSTKKGVVTLTGTVSSREDSDRIVRMVKNVHGVVGVDNQLTIANN